MISYDFDGVLVADVRMPPEIPLEEWLKLRQYMLPIFRPKAPWILLTGRPRVDKTLTESWLEKNDMKPEMIFHDNTNTEEPWLYKEEILRTHSIEAHVENDPRVIHHLVMYGHPVVNFPAFLRDTEWN